MEHKKTMPELLKEALTNRLLRREKETEAKEPAIWGLTKDKTPKKPIQGL